MSADSAGTSDTLSGVLAEVDEWPVGTAGAAVVTAGAEPVLHGDTGRLFALTSVSKLITCYSVLIAVEEGAFELDDTVADIVAEYGTAVEAPQDVTVRELLSHASGVGMNSREQEKPARSRRIYSSAGFDILADLVSSTGIPFFTYVREGLCEPLGIDLHLSGSAGHGFGARLGDLAVLAGEFLSPTLISEKLWDEALTPQFPDLNGVVPGYGPQRPCPWGLGMELHGEKSPHWLSEDMPADVAGHFGQAGTFLWFHRTTGSAAVALTDRPFGDWAKERWDGFNDRLWAVL
ncbi:MAG TPA: beta-lactamase family protein [Candidatus Corynebacterium avicola]|uniref:Beta-lactamase family protein n=1 Tax=Candidatus Corynebacterium avicola TaxID=2838527 RepID=A0A9D1RN71_9CORY|nr:beta-lactamase family protein [Candidatus Corynebacterium avicola]